MPLTLAPDELDRLLEPIRMGLEADGYRLSARVAGERLQLEVEATPAACADCLVSKAIMETMVRQALRAQGGPADAPIEIGYPKD